VGAPDGLPAPPSLRLSVRCHTLLLIVLPLCAFFFAAATRHTKDAWGGWTFDSHLFPFPADSMESLGALGLPVTLNTHDAQVSR
jgi:hypothetical protein